MEELNNLTLKMFRRARKKAQNLAQKVLWLKAIIAKYAEVHHSGFILARKTVATLQKLCKN